MHKQRFFVTIHDIEHNLTNEFVGVGTDELTAKGNAIFKARKTFKTSELEIVDIEAESYRLLK